VKLINRMSVLRFKRICAILNRARKPVSVAVLAARLEVCEKTVERDLEFMKSQLELPIMSGYRGQWLSQKVTLCACCAGRV